MDNRTREEEKKKDKKVKDLTNVTMRKKKVKKPIKI